MRIGIITGEYPPMEGGVGDFTRRLAVALYRQRHDVHILTRRQPQAADVAELEEGPLVHRRIDATGWPMLRTINRWIHTVAPDAVNVQYQAAAYGMRGAINIYPRLYQRRRFPLTVTFHDLLPPYLFPKAGPLRKWSVKTLAQHADGVITTNTEDQHKLRRELELPATRVRLIPIGSNIDPSPPADFTPRRWRAAYDIGNDNLLLGFFGFMNQSKGIETLIDALGSLVAKDMPVKLVFIGGRTGSSDRTNKEYADTIDARIAKQHLSEHIRATGFTNPSEVSAALLSLDLCILPYRDGASLRHGTLHAALKHGNAIITTRPRIPVPQLRHRQNCYLVPPDDPEALERGILSLADRPQQRRALGQGARALAQSFSWDRIAERTVEFLSALQ